jgi:hypothetical protein
MDIPKAIELNRSALDRIIAGLFLLLGLTGGSAPGRIAADLHRAIARVLRPAESAVRRLIVVYARITSIKLPPAPPMPAGIVRGETERRPGFPLFDPRQRFALLQPQARSGPRPQPRITFFGTAEVQAVSSRSQAPKDEQSDAERNAAHLVFRLQALKAALDDLPHQAKRLARALARRRKIVRLRARMPLRPGRAPGFRRKPMQQIDHVLHECDWLARNVLPPDSS